MKLKNNEERTPERLLLIGVSGFAGIDSIPWESDSVPNIPDYDIVIVSVPHLTADILKKAKSQYFDTMRKAFISFLHSGGKLVILASSYLSVHRPKSYPEYLSNYNWSPITFGIVNESGSSIVIKRDMYSSYLRRMANWSFYFTIPKDCLTDDLTSFYGSTYDTRYRIPLMPYLENRYGRVLSGQCHIEVRKEQKSSNIYGHTYSTYPDIPDYISGIIILIPLIEDIMPEEALADILKEEIGYSLASIEPDWAKDIEMPFVADLNNNISQASAVILEEQKKIKNFSEKIDEINSYRRLLYGTGPELEDVVKKSFSFLGAKIAPAKYGQEEYILEINNEEYLVEVKGVAKSITLGHLRQLNDYILKYQEDTGKVCRGILFGNAWRNLPPSDRGLESTPEFPDNVIQRAQQWGISLVSSRRFFFAFVEALNDKNKAPKILSAVISANGVADIE
jgi:hypothetical protein